MTNVGVIKDGNHDPIEENESSEDVNLRPPWDHEGASNPCDLRPVERHDTHSQTSSNPKELINSDVLWDNPANPRKYREPREQES